MSIQIVGASDLENLLGSDLQLLDVRLKEDYDAVHLPRAVNNCVFEVEFLNRVRDSVQGQHSPLCVYGAKNSYESRLAAEKLQRAGYDTVLDFRGGLQEWLAEELPVERAGDLPTGPALDFDGDYPLDLAESRVEWIGRNLLNKHWGYVGVRSGHLNFTRGRLTGGDVVLDMQALTCGDLHGNPLHDVLIEHLKSDDFFDVERFPEARFNIQSSSRIKDVAPGGRNLAVRGELTLKGATKPIEFKASAGPTLDGKPAAQASVTIDRTEWNILYGSGRFFSRLGGHLVNDDIELHLRIVTA